MVLNSSTRAVIRMEMLYSRVVEIWMRFSHDLKTKHGNTNLLLHSTRSRQTTTALWLLALSPCCLHRSSHRALPLSMLAFSLGGEVKVFSFKTFKLTWGGPRASQVHSLPFPAETTAVVFVVVAFCNSVVLAVHRLLLRSLASACCEYDILMISIASIIAVHCTCRGLVRTRCRTIKLSL